MAKKDKSKTKLSFDDFFSEFYSSRWDTLKKAMIEKDFKVWRRNKFSDLKMCESLELRPIEWLESCYYPGENSEDLKLCDENGIRLFYGMDPASIIVARTLAINSGDEVLDMCAAPGGKTLVLFESLVDGGNQKSNEVSRTRRDRLKRVIRDYIPEEKRMRISISGKDGLRFGLDEVETYDKILVDAPCSGEKHILESESELSKWTVKRTKRLAGLQYGLLCSALLAAKKEAEIVYSTCSISPLENDDVLEKLLSKKGDQFEFSPLEGPIYDLGEKTKYGVIFLPDHCGFGPLFVSRLKKIN
ncbi:hypothetical protein HBN50_02190 [Halobacteriovorax sp. GB3]|uniref:hypothetical protein n=1 Tax=Halobacteriovorax sp. GB3 TaxID=2719615 RepID=UPI002361BF4D|nr:hypothetical protein [Halobacteriovorax sp. GB3]MDD0851882.1 hypothetical protein [Halobacteriovorax sp. GB3]